MHLTLVRLEKAEARYAEDNFWKRASTTALSQISEMFYWSQVHMQDMEYPY